VLKFQVFQLHLEGQFASNLSRRKVPRLPSQNDDEEGENISQVRTHVNCGKAIKDFTLSGNYGKNRPFLLVLSFPNVHAPYTVRPQDKPYFKEEQIPRTPVRKYLSFTARQR